MVHEFFLKIRCTGLRLIGAVIVPNLDKNMAILEAKIEL